MKMCNCCVDSFLHFNLGELKPAVEVSKKFRNLYPEGETGGLGLACQERGLGEANSMSCDGEACAMKYKTGRLQW